MAEYKIGYGVSTGKPYLKIPGNDNVAVRLGSNKNFPNSDKLISFFGNVGHDREPEDFTLEHLKLIDIKVLDLPIVRQHLKAALEECIDAIYNQDSP